MFNLVGQVLIYSLKDCGYFEWWEFHGDPCSLYAENTAIFLPDLHALLQILAHIEWVGRFTGLQFNINKTIAFCPGIQDKLILHGVQVCSVPVKYLGIFLGTGDLSRLNFEQPLRKMKNILNKWAKQNLTLDAKILIVKTFAFSVFTHVLNCTYVTVHQLEIIQKILNKFVCVWGETQN